MEQMKFSNLPREIASIGRLFEVKKWNKIYDRNYRQMIILKIKQYQRIWNFFLQRNKLKVMRMLQTDKEILKVCKEVTSFQFFLAIAIFLTVLIFPI